MAIQERNAPKVDVLLLSAVLALVGLGLVMVYSASAVTAQDKLGDALYYLKRQAVAAVLGLGGMALAMKVGYRRLGRLAYPLLGLAVLAMLALFVPGLGVSVGGARRWLRVPGISFQPTELLKFAWIVYLSFSLAKKKQQVETFSVGVLPHLIVGGVLVGLCMAQPDFGSSVVLGLLLMVLLMAAGARLGYLFMLVPVVAPVAWYAVVSSPYRMKRITAFLDPWAHRHTVGYQVAESLMSIGSGGVWGLGLGNGMQKLYFLPEAHTDFIFSIVGEELGLAGVLVMVGLYGIVIWRGLKAALVATEAFGSYLAIGITGLIALQSIINMSVAMGLAPTKGLTLPFVSYGGSSLIILMGATGVLLSVGAGAPERSRSRTVSNVMRMQAAEVGA